LLIPFNGVTTVGGPLLSRGAIWHQVNCKTLK